MQICWNFKGADVTKNYLLHDNQFWQFQKPTKVVEINSIK